MVVPIVYRKNPPFQVSYDWTDSIANCGYIRFYGNCSALTGAKTLFLSKNSIDSSSYYSTTDQAIYTSSAAGDDIDKDFDITFTVPITVAAAECIVNFSRWEQDACGAAQCVVTVYHVTAAGVETSIGTATTPSNNWGSDQYLRECIKMTLTQKTFVAGEKLRLTINITNGGALGTMKLYHDSSGGLTLTDSIGRTIGTDITVDVPFVLDN